MAKKETSAKNSISFNKSSTKKHITDTFTKNSGINKNLLSDTQAIYQSLYANPISLLTSSKKGLDAKAALDFLDLSGFSQEQFQETFKTTVKTIQNYNRNELKLDASLSEKLLKSFALFENGIAVFGSAKGFNSWIHEPAFGLGDQIPFEMMDTITGISLVDDELTRIAYGDLA